MIDDRTFGDLSDDQLRHGLVFKLSPLSHDDVGRVWFERLLSTAVVPQVAGAGTAGARIAPRANR